MADGVISQPYSERHPADPHVPHRTPLARAVNRKVHGSNPCSGARFCIRIASVSGLWRNTANSPTGAYDTYGYDSTAGGSAGIGRLTGETFSAGLLSGSYAYT